MEPMDSSCSGSSDLGPLDPLLAHITRFGLAS